MKTNLFKNFRNSLTAASMILMAAVSWAQTSVYDVISTSPNHTLITQAIDQENLDVVLDDQNNTFTVFAPDDAAINNFLNETNQSAMDLLNNANLSDIIEYHLLGADVASSAIVNGDIETPENNANTLKLTVDGSLVFVNQAQVNDPDLTADNGRVHSIDGLLLPNETVADVAIDSPDHTTLVSAVTEARLLPDLTNPLDTMTVFAPDDAAFTESLNDLGISATDLLQSADLADILLYHVLGAEVNSGDLSNGMVATPLNSANTIKVTVTGGGDVYANQAQVTTADISADNGVVHVLNQAIFTDETVVDAAIDNGFTILDTALIEAELYPALTDPFEEFTIFAPTDNAFTTYLSDEGITAADLLTSPALQDILLYHALDSEVLSTDLTNGTVTTINGADVLVDLSNGVMINDAEVVTADVDVDNGVVHAIDYVLDPAEASVKDEKIAEVQLFPNPAEKYIQVRGFNAGKYTILNSAGAIVKSGELKGSKIDVETLNVGTYTIILNDDQQKAQSSFVKK